MNPGVSANFLQELALGGLTTPLSAVGTEYRLATAGPSPPDHNSVPGDFTEATFGNYAPVLGTGVTVTQAEDDEGNLILVITDLLWQGDDPPSVPETITHIYVVAAGGELLLACELLVPKLMTQGNALLVAMARINMADFSFEVDPLGD